MPALARSQPLSPHARAYYREVIAQLTSADVSFLIGGAYALAHYTGIERHTKDLDIFVRRRDFDRVVSLLARAGHATELSFPHWLGKAYRGGDFVDIIFSSGNGIATVDDEWFAHAATGQVLDLPVRLSPPEEMIWSKGFIMERERFDGADILHLLRARAATFDWERLLRRFDSHWRVLLTHLLMFGYVYPGERAAIPRWLMDELLRRLQVEVSSQPPTDTVCFGTVLSREQYLVDVEDWGYRDARLPPQGHMTPKEIARWTAEIEGVRPRGSGEPRT